MASAFDLANNLTINSYKKRFNRVEEQFKSGQITEEEYARKKEDLEKKQALATWRIQRRLFVVQKIPSTVVHFVSSCQVFLNVLQYLFFFS